MYAANLWKPLSATPVPDSGYRFDTQTSAGCVSRRAFSTGWPRPMQKAFEDMDAVEPRSYRPIRTMQRMEQGIYWLRCGPELAPHAGHRR